MKPEIPLMLVAVAVALLPAGVPVALGGVGLCLSALAAAAFRVSVGDLALAANDAAVVSFLVVNNGLWLAGFGLVVMGAVIAWRNRLQLPAITAVAAVGAATEALIPSFGPTGWVRPIGAGIAVVGVASVASSLAGILRLGLAADRVDGVLAPARPPHGHPWVRIDRLLLGVSVAGMAAALLGGLLWLVLAGGLIVGVAAHWLAWRKGRVPVFPTLPLCSLALVPCWWLMATIAGPVGQSLRALPDGPFSAAAETLLVVLIGVAAFAFAGLWPLHGLVPGGLLVPVAAALFLRVANPVLPDGMAHWQGLLVPLALPAVWLGGASGRAALVGTGLVWIGLVSGEPSGWEGACWLAGVVTLLAAADALRRPLPLPVMRLLVVAAAWGGLLVLEGILRTQVVYGVLATAGVAAAVWRRQAR